MNEYIPITPSLCGSTSTFFTMISDEQKLLNFLFEIDSNHVVQTRLKLTMWPGLVSNSRQSSSLNPSSFNSTWPALPHPEVANFKEVEWISSFVHG